MKREHFGFSLLLPTIIIIKFCKTGKMHTLFQEVRMLSDEIFWKLVAGHYLLFGQREQVVKIFEESVDFLKTKYGKPDDITESEVNWYLERTRISLEIFDDKFNGWFLERNYADQKEKEFKGEAP
jgi:hypothetical protein